VEIHFQELVNRTFSQERANLTQSWNRGLGVCILAHPTEYLLWVQLVGYLVEVLGALVKGAVADHCDGDTYDEDARFGN
jgi:hypothetical protein